jgi:hypothetical protein
MSTTSGSGWCVGGQGPAGRHHTASLESRKSMSEVVRNHVEDEWK